MATASSRFAESAVAPDASKVLLCGFDGYLRDFDVDSGEFVAEFQIVEDAAEPGEQQIWRSRCSQDLKYLLVVPAYAKFGLLIDTESGETRHQFNHDGVVRSLAFSHDNQ